MGIVRDFLAILGLVVGAVAIDKVLEVFLGIPGLLSTRLYWLFLLGGTAWLGFARGQNPSYGSDYCNPLFTLPTIVGLAGILAYFGNFAGFRSHFDPFMRTFFVLVIFVYMLAGVVGMFFRTLLGKKK